MLSPVNSPVIIFGDGDKCLKWLCPRFMTDYTLNGERERGRRRDRPTERERKKNRDREKERKEEREQVNLRRCNRSKKTLKIHRYRSNNRLLKNWFTYVHRMDYIIDSLSKYRNWIPLNRWIIDLNHSFTNNYQKFSYFIRFITV